jgi:hypothetical protein
LSITGRVSWIDEKKKERKKMDGVRGKISRKLKKINLRQQR